MLTKFIKFWLMHVCDRLDLKEYIFGRDNNNQGAVAARPDNVEGEQPQNQAVESDAPLYKPPYFGLKILILVTLGWLTILTLFVVLLTFPIKLGRFVLLFFCGDCRYLCFSYWFLYNLGIGVHVRFSLSKNNTLYSS
jgi:hypothetical protein